MEGSDRSVIHLLFSKLMLTVTEQNSASVV